MMCKSERREEQVVVLALEISGPAYVISSEGTSDLLAVSIKATQRSYSKYERVIKLPYFA